MKTTKTRLKLLIDRIEQKIINKEKYFNDSNESWQKSYKGKTHSDKTEKLKEIRESMLETETLIDEYIDNS